jgi:hypothetical protein
MTANPGRPALILIKERIARGIKAGPQAAAFIDANQGPRPAGS